MPTLLRVFRGRRRKSGYVLVVPRRIILTPEAVADIGEAFRWYAAQRQALGDEFLACLEATYALIAEHPEHFPFRFDSFRRALVRRFPYAAYFEHDELTVIVHCVFHCARDPARLARRLRGPEPNR
ncbi:MAG: type II toxin-antitoxin system RelE/ParE family toxin [Verrucomicrobiia bacterium]